MFTDYAALIQTAAVLTYVTKLSSPRKWAASNHKKDVWIMTQSNVLSPPPGFCPGSECLFVWELLPKQFPVALSFHVQHSGDVHIRKITLDFVKITHLEVATTKQTQLAWKHFYPMWNTTENKYLFSYYVVFSY